MASQAEGHEFEPRLPLHLKKGATFYRSSFVVFQNNSE